MYNEYFGLTENPFSIAPDPRYLYLSEQHREALAHLLYGITSDGGFVLLTGEVGTGKTTISRCLLEQIPDDCEVAFIFNPKLTVEELLSTICDEFGIEYPTGTSSIKVFVDLINRYLLDAHAGGRKAVLIIDEAQNLKSDVLEQIRLLTNLETNQRKLLQIILLGQPELRDKLSRPELRQLAQRIIARYHLGPLNSREVAAYVNHRLTVAGARRLIFPLPTLALLHRLSRGIPRLINVLCDRALLGSYVQGKESVDRPTLIRAAQEVFVEANSRREIYKKVAFWSLAVLLTLGGGALMSTAYYHYRPQTVGTGSTVTGKVQQSVPAPPADFSQRKAPLSENRKSTSPGVEMSAAANADQSATGERSTSIPIFTENSKPAPAGQANSLNGPEPLPLKESSPGLQKPEQLAKTAEPLEETHPRALQPEHPASLTWPADEPISDSQSLAFEALFKQWGAAFKVELFSSACQQAQAQSLACLSGKASLDDLYKFNRPAVLKLYDGQGREFYATLTGLRGRQAQFIAGSKHLTVSFDEISLRWLGDYTLLWRMPPNYQGMIKVGDRGPQVDWLYEQLSKVQNKPVGNKTNVIFDEAMSREVKKFQLTSGLQPDGIVGPHTLILLNTAVGADTPELTSDNRDD